MRISDWSSDVCSSDLIRRVVLVGAGDLCEIATLAAADSGIEVAAIFDQETNRQQMAGVKILRDPAQLGGIEAAVITDMRNPQAAYEHMAETIGADRVYFPSLLRRSEEHTSELQSLMRISYAVFCLKKKKQTSKSYKQPI